jgi:predicted lactoylglutathione lyase
VENIKFKRACPVFVSDDFYKTVNFYTEKLGFKYAGQFDRIGGSFAILYNDSIEIMVVETTWGKSQSVQQTCDMDFDAYIFVELDSPKQLWDLHREFLSKEIKIIDAPRYADVGMCQFVFEDIDGRHIAISYICDKEEYLTYRNIEV